MPHTPHVSVAARKPLPSGIGSLDDGSRAVVDARGLTQEPSDNPPAAVRAPAVPAGARNDGAPRVVEGPRTLAGRAHEELAFERAAAQLRPSWASEPLATQSAVRNLPSTSDPAAQQAESASTHTAEASDLPVSALSDSEPERVALLAPPPSSAPIDFAALTTSRAPMLDDTQALRAALEAPKRKIRKLALTGTGCLVLGALIALFAGGDSSDEKATAGVATQPVPVNSVSQVPVREPAIKQPTQPATNAPEQAAAAPEPNHPSPLAAKALPVKPASKAALPAAKPVTAKPGLAAVKPAQAKPAAPVAKPVPAKAAAVATKAAPAKASPVATKAAPAKAALLPARPAPGKQATKPASLAAKAAPGKPAFSAKPRKGVPVTTKPIAVPTKNGRVNPVDVLNPWAN